MVKLKNGDHVWIIDSSIYVKEVEIINFKYDFATIKFLDSSSGTRVRINRLYRTKEEAERVMSSNKKN